MDGVQRTSESEAAAPIACSLGAADYSDRITQWRTVLDGCDVDEVPGGARATLPADRAADLAALVVAERECCVFLEFTMVFRDGAVELTVTAPPGAEVLVSELMR